MVSKILGKQEIKNSIKYRLFNYCLLREIDNEYVVYNNMTKATAILNENEVLAIKNVPIAADDTVKGLIEDWFLVPVDNDDLKLCDQLFDMLEVFEDKTKIDSYTILTTTDCNARCFYCFECTLKRINMTPQTANDTADFILKNCKGAPVTIKWFGGEPLFNSEAIDIICEKLIANDIEFSSTMISNGYLFNDVNIEKAINKWNLKKVQITLDGTESIYNATKAYIYKDGGNPFLRVTDNIDKISSLGIHVRIRLNLTKDNKENLYTLIDWLDERYPIKENISMYCTPIWDTDKKRWEMDWHEPFSEKVIMNAYIYEKGFSTSRTIKPISMRGCKAQKYGSVVVMPNGDLGKCDTRMEDMMYGNIYSSQIDQAVLEFWMHRTVIEQCKTCIAYPDCAGYDSCPNFTRKCELVTKEYHENRMAHSMRMIYEKYKKNID